MSQGMDGSLFIDAAFPQGFPEGNLQRINAYVAVFVGVEKFGASFAVLPIVQSKKLKWAFMQRNIAVFAALAVTNAQKIPLAVDVAYFKPIFRTF